MAEYQESEADELIELWLKALDNGQYSEAAKPFRRMKGEKGFSSIGVLCDLFDNTRWCTIEDTIFFNNWHDIAFGMHFQQDLPVEICCYLLEIEYSDYAQYQLVYNFFNENRELSHKSMAAKFREVGYPLILSERKKIHG